MENQLVKQNPIYQNPYVFNPKEFLIGFLITISITSTTFLLGPMILEHHVMGSNVGSVMLVIAASLFIPILIVWRFTSCGYFIYDLIALKSSTNVFAYLMPED